MADPKPPIAADVDLRDFHFMPLDVVQLANSETWALADGWAAKACINLWCRAWHQVPAGSLPDNDAVLCGWSGVPNWDEVREIAMRGFVKHRDGRLYHSVLVEKAQEAWERKEEGAADREADRQRKKEWRERKRQKNQGSRPVGQDKDGTPCPPGTDPGQDAEIRSMTGTGTETGIHKKGTSNEVPKESSGELILKPPENFDRTGFAVWWKLYPRKVGKRAAEQIYLRVLRKRDATILELVDGLRASIAYWDSEGRETKFIIHPERWLSKGHWKDDLTVRKKMSAREIILARGASHGDPGTGVSDRDSETEQLGPPVV